jgi:hypothetical protein
MTLFPISQINIDSKKIKEIEEIMKSTLRLITFSRKHLADDLLNTYIDSSANLQELLSIKNAQMEAQDDFEAEEYLNSLNRTLKNIIKEIKNNIDFNSEVQLFNYSGLFRQILIKSTLINIELLMFKLDNTFALHRKKFKI